jgi:hypothetical protein
MQLAYLQPLFWIVPTVPDGYVYHINFPGSVATNPLFTVTKGKPTDATGLVFTAGTIIQIGSYPTFDAAQNACETDYSATTNRSVPPIPAPTSTYRQPTQPVTPLTTVVGALASFPDAPVDGNIYGRQNNAWVLLPVVEAPTDGKLYGRQNSAWVVVPP